MKSIAIYVPSFRGGGAERVAINLAIGLSRSGHKTTLIAVDASGPLKDSIPDSIIIIDLKKTRVMASLPQLISCFRLNRFDVVISIMLHTNIVANIAGAISRTPVISTIHNTVTEEFGTSIKDTILKLFVKITYRHSKAIVCVSQGSRVDFNSYFPALSQKTGMIYNPVVDNNPISFSPPEHPWFNEKRTQPVILAVGRLAEQKNFMLLLEAFNLLKNKIDARLVIFGEGTDRPQLEAYIQEHNLQDSIELPGFTSRIMDHMNNCDLFVMSSIYEGLACVIIEAMSLGLPIVSTNCPSGPEELFDNDSPAIIVEMNNSIALANGMELALTKENKRVSYPIVSEFTIESSTNAYEELINIC